MGFAMNQYRISQQQLVLLREGKYNRQLDQVSKSEVKARPVKVQLLRQCPALIGYPELNFSPDLGNVLPLQEFPALLKTWSFCSQRGNFSAEPRTQTRV